MRKENNSCRFCHPERFPSRYFEKYGLDYLDEYPIYNSEQITVIPDVLPGNPNFHGLIVPKIHKHAFAQISNLQNEVGEIACRFERLFNRPPAFFEHGGGSKQQESNIQSVYHEHMHALDPEGLDVIPIMAHFLSQQGIRPRIFNYWDQSDPSPIFELKGLYRGYPYLYVKHGRWGLWIDDPDDNLPSQLTQRFMHSVFSGTTELNWKEIPVNGEFEKLSVHRIKNMIDRLHQCEQEGKF